MICEENGDDDDQETRWIIPSLETSCIVHIMVPWQHAQREDDSYAYVYDGPSKLAPWHHRSLRSWDQLLANIHIEKMIHTLMRMMVLASLPLDITVAPEVGIMLPLAYPLLAWCRRRDLQWITWQCSQSPIGCNRCLHLPRPAKACPFWLLLKSHCNPLLFDIHYWEFVEERAKRQVVQKCWEEINREWPWLCLDHCRQ